MKKVKILKAHWKCNNKLLGDATNITTTVIKQGKYIIDPSNEDFLSAIIKILKKLDIDLKSILKRYMVLPFPESL